MNNSNLNILKYLYILTIRKSGINLFLTVRNYYGEIKTSTSTGTHTPFNRKKEKGKKWILTSLFESFFLKIKKMGVFNLIILVDSALGKWGKILSKALRRYVFNVIFLKSVIRNPFSLRDRTRKRNHKKTHRAKKKMKRR